MPAQSLRSILLRPAPNGDCLPLVDWASHLSFETEFAEKLALNKEALAIVQPLLAANPSPSAQEIVADRLSAVGWLNDLVQRYDIAKPAYEESLELLLLAEKDSRALSVQSSLAGVFGLLGNLAVKMGDKPAAVQNAEKAVGIRRKILTINPERGGQTGLAYSLSELGTAYQANGQFEQALRARREEMVIWRKLLETSQSPGMDNERLSKSLLTTAHTATLANDIPFAQASYREGLDRLRATYATDPVFHRRQLEYSLSSYAKAAGTPPELKLSLLEERVVLLRDTNDPAAPARRDFRSRPRAPRWRADQRRPCRFCRGAGHHRHCDRRSAGRRSGTPDGGPRRI
ncbi:MAG: hypothetical protein ACJLS3_00530 [Erythrobacter sp.]